MTFVSFPIAYPNHSVNLLSPVFPITLLLPEDDTPDVIPRHTMLRHAYHVSVTRNFRLNPKEDSGLSSLDPNQPICIHASMCSASRAGETRDRAERGSKAAKRMSTPLPQERERESDSAWAVSLRSPRSLRSLRRRSPHRGMSCPAAAGMIPSLISLLTCFT